MAQPPDKDKAREDQLARDGAEFFRTLINLTKQHHKIMTEVAVSNAAILSTLLDRFPELGASYERYLQVAEKESPFVQNSRRIAEEFDRLTAAVKKTD